MRRKFSDGVWLWVVGPPDHRWRWDTDHHAACCTSSSDQWQATQHNRSSYIVSPMARHLRCEARAMCLCAARSAAAETRPALARVTG